MEQKARILSLILDIGEIMLTSGAEVNRVEDTINRIAVAYGFSRADVFTITYSIVVSVTDKDGEVYTQTRRTHSSKTDMNRLEKCNALSRKVCRSPLSTEKLETEIELIRNSDTYSNRTMLIWYGVISAAFTLFYGGNALDAAASFFCGLILWCITYMSEKLVMNAIIRNIICSVCSAIAAVLFACISPDIHSDKIIIGTIMLLIPGMAFTTSIRDMINGDIISGMLGLCDALLRAVAIAVGFALVLWKWGVY